MTRRGQVEEKHKNSFVQSMTLLFHEMLRLGGYHYFCGYEQVRISLSSAS